MRRISVSSSVEARLLASACITSFDEDPPNAIHQIADELPLRLFFGQARLIDVRAIGLVATNEAFFRHDLQQLERGRTVGRSRIRTSWTCRTVLGPSCQSTRKIASSASVGRGVLDI